MKKVKTFTLISSSVVGLGGISIPLGITSCKGKDGGDSDYSNDGLKKQKFIINWDIDNKTLSQWSSGFVAGSIDATQWSAPNGFHIGVIGGSTFLKKSLSTDQQHIHVAIIKGIFQHSDLGSTITNLKIENSNEITPITENGVYEVKLLYHVSWIDNNGNEYMIYAKEQKIYNSITIA